MRIVLQKVRSASVTVEEQVVGSIGQGALLLVGFQTGDSREHLKPLAAKVAQLRIFSRDEKSFDLSLLDTGFPVLVVSQFTLYANCERGRRPDFSQALKPDEAKSLYNEFVQELKAMGLSDVQEGIFGAMMQVALENDGPVTLLLER